MSSSTTSAHAAPTESTLAQLHAMIAALADGGDCGGDCGGGDCDCGAECGVVLGVLGVLGDALRDAAARAALCGAARHIADALRIARAITNTNIVVGCFVSLLSRLFTDNLHINSNVTSSNLISSFLQLSFLVLIVLFFHSLV